MKNFDPPQIESDLFTHAVHNFYLHKRILNVKKKTVLKIKTLISMAKNGPIWALFASLHSYELLVEVSDAFVFVPVGAPTAIRRHPVLD